MQTQTILVFLYCAVVFSQSTYQERYYAQTLDHFQSGQKTSLWSQRYLINDTFWDGRGDLGNGCKGPILLYTGNEGDITAFWNGNGFMIDRLAPKWGGLLLFPEQRYFGKSLPFGSKSYEPANLVYLTTEQVLMDIVELLNYIKSDLNASSCPVIAFGGSYGGTLTTFLRTAYPSVVIGGLASSAPIGYYDVEGWSAHGVTQFTWSDIVTRVYDEAHPRCMQAIHSTSAAIDELARTSMQDAISTFHVCDASSFGPDRVSDFFAYALENIPQQNYPYAIGSNPAWPVNATCQLLVDALTHMERNPEQYATQAANPLVAVAAHITDLYLGWDGEKCISLAEGPGGIPGDGPGPGPWGYQSCTQNLHMFSARGVRNYDFDLKTSAVLPCQHFFGADTYPATNDLALRYGGWKLGDGRAGVSHLIWSNGLLDPWSGGGFLQPGPSESGNYWFLMEKGAHHLDLRGDHPDDPTHVREVRRQEEAIMDQWIKDWVVQQQEL